MILTMFAALIALAIVAFFLGYFTGDGHYVLVGLTFLFLIGVLMFSGSVEYETGVTVTAVNGTITSVDYDFTPANDSTTRMTGVFLAAGSIAGFALVFFNFKRSKQ